MPKFRRANYTQTPNEVYDILLRSLTPVQFKVVSAVVRKTIGFHLDVAPLSTSDIMDLTGLSKQCVVDSVSTLCDLGWVEKIRQDSNGKSLPSLYTLGIEEVSTALTPTSDGGVNGVDPLGVNGVDPLYIGSIKERKKENTPLIPSENEELSVEPCDEDGSVPVRSVRSKSRWPSRRKEPKQKGLAARISEAASGSDDAAPSRFEFRRRATAIPPPPCPDLDTIKPIIDAWNSAVSSCPADLNPIHDRTVIARAHASMSDPEFSGSVEEIMRKCAEIRKSRPDQSSWCTFRWLFSQKGDQPVNWFKVKCGVLDWKPVDSRPQSQQQKNRSLTEKLLAEARARKAATEDGPTK